MNFFINLIQILGVSCIVVIDNTFNTMTTGHTRIYL